MAWLYLLAAGVFEIIWAFSMKQSGGFTVLVPSIITIAAMVVSFALLAVAMRDFPLGTAYAVWTGIGTIGAFIIGIMFLGEPATWLRMGCALLILTGLFGLKVSSGT